MAYPIVNVCCFLLGWACCVLGAAYHMPMLGPAVVALLLIGQSFFMADPSRQLGLVTVVSLIGLVIDSLLIASGLYLPVEPSGSWLCPLWIIALWINFATTIHGCFFWLARRPLVTAVVGAVWFPLGYLMQWKLSAIQIMATPEMFLLQTIVLGALLLPAFFFLAARSPYRVESQITRKNL